MTAAPMTEKADAISQIDLEALREKYRIERDRRIRPDGEGQYVEVSGRYARYGEEDPYNRQAAERAPINGDVEVLVIGGGWSGLAAAGRLKLEGVEDVRVLDAGSDFGGTWYWNRYPGCQCDVDAYIYLPFLEETNYLPTVKYAFAPEIFEHARRIGRTFGLYEKAIFQTWVREMRWNEELGRWIIKTNRGDELRARFAIVATGPSSRPKLPSIPGMDDFQGKMFHTARWDFDYTGGDNTGNLHKLKDKSVAFIGTGGTAIQCVSHLGEWSKELYVFQRTPSSVGPRGNVPTDPDWAKSLKPGWQAERMRNFEDFIAGKDVPNLVNDAFTNIFADLRQFLPKAGLESLTPEEMQFLSELADAKVMNEKRARVDEQVNDPVIAEKLKPWYRLMCKRPTYNDHYLTTFNRPNVTLVDTSECHGVERITEDGIVANGVEHKVDCIIFGTGFETSTAFRKRFGFEINGVGGESLFDHWKDGLRTLHGWGSHGFPNWFWVGLSQNGLSANNSSSLTVAGTHVAKVIKAVMDKGAKRVEPTAEAEQAWVDEIQRLAVMQVDFFEDCTPGYYNNEGQIRNSTSVVAPLAAYGPGPNAFEDVITEWRDNGKLEGLQLD